MPDPDLPVAPPRPTALRHGGDERIDPWFWLSARDDPEVLGYLEAENDYTEGALEHLAPLREELFTEIVSRVQETDAGAPVRRAPFEYFARTVEGHQYPVQCRRPVGTPGLPDPASPPGAAPGETIVLDENELAGDHEFFSVGDLTVSTDQALVAYSTDTTGGERYELRVRALDRAETFADVVPDIYYGVAWANDNATLFYTRPDDAMRPWQIWRHTLGTAADDDVLVFQEDDDRFYVSVGRARSGRYVIISSASKVTSEVWLVDADDPTAPPTVVEPREQGHEYHVEHHVGRGGDRLFVLTNSDGAVNFRLMVTPTATPGRASWTEVLAHRVDARLDDVDAFADHLVVSERADAVERLRVLQLAPDGAVADDHVVAPPDEVYSQWIGGNVEYETSTLRYHYTSLVTPSSAYDYDIETRVRDPRQAPTGSRLRP